MWERLKLVGEVIVGILAVAAVVAIVLGSVQICLVDRDHEACEKFIEMAID